ncbi:hypothetical protein M0C40_04995 [Spiroplasma citri]|uniref:Adhesin P123 n=1 Tax=Spiroplasma citri TaxID=2133 RepID=A0AAX3SW39_SPICI|nr:hypothetical protein [Spiroplasma citri]WFG95456.1 hypothetical protein M0C40_04995 [Spiroplasma citri]
MKHYYFWLKERFQTDNSINITYPTINDFSKIDYNEYIKLIVPFDNDTIYYENNVWKAKQGGVIPSIENNKLSLNKGLKDTIEQILKWVLEINKKIKWEKVSISYTPDSSIYIDIPEFSEKYRYDVRISPTNFKKTEGFLLLEPPYFTKTKENKTLVKQQSNSFAGDVGKISYDLSLFNSSGRVYLTDVSTGNNTAINSVRIFRQEV